MEHLQDQRQLRRLAIAATVLILLVGAISIRSCIPEPVSAKPLAEAAGASSETALPNSQTVTMGINTAIFTRTGGYGGYMGIGFAIPSNSNARRAS